MRSRGVVLIALCIIPAVIFSMAVSAAAATINYTVSVWGPNQYPATTAPPEGSPWGVSGYPGDTIELATYAGTLDLTPGTYTLKINTLNWKINYTYGGTATDWNAWSDVLFNITAIRSISFDGGPAGSLSQTGLLRCTWDNDYITFDNGSNASFDVQGCKVKVTPLGLSQAGTDFPGAPYGNPWTQPSQDVMATFEVTPAVTGDPEADGWTFGGYSLAKGYYVRNSANYGFKTYSTKITVSAGSILDISDGTYSWLAGDTVIGLGGRFAGITAAEAGWSAFTGNGVNAILGEDTKFVGKFGTSNATFSASTIAPDAGNGTGSTGAGGDGTVFMRSSGWFYAADWSAHSGTLMLLDKDTHIERLGTSSPDKRVGRLIWIWDGVSGHVASWQLLLNTSLLDRTAPSGFSGLTPSAGDSAIMSVQRRDGIYTDTLVTMAPEPMPSTCYIPADIDRDEDVDTNDLKRITDSWLTDDPNADLYVDSNNIINFQDFSILNDLWMVDRSHLAEITSPNLAETLAGQAVTFQWSAGLNVQEYELMIGTTGPGSGNIFSGSTGTTQLQYVEGLPADGSIVYVRLSSKINGVWCYIDYMYKAF